MPKAHVVLGKAVEITNAEARELAEYSAQMASLTRHQRTGWFLAWCMAHKEAHKVLRTIIERSHATVGPEREQRH